MKLIVSITDENYRKATNFKLRDEWLDRNIDCEFSSENAPAYQAYHYNDPIYVERMTIKRTGPACVRNIIEELCDKPQKTQDFDNVITPVRSIPKEYRKPVRKLGLHWLKRKIRSYSLEVAVAKAIESIRFEVEKMQFLRLEDHVDDLVTVMEPVSEEIVITKFFTTLREANFNFQHVIAAQLTYRYPEVLTFYREIGLPMVRTVH